MRSRSSNLFWGIILILVAVFIIVNQFTAFADFGAGSIIVTVLAIAAIVNCFAKQKFAFLPIPLAFLYIVFHSPLELPYISSWTLIMASILASIGLNYLLPKKNRSFRFFRNKSYDRHEDKQRKIHAETLDSDNHHVLSSNFNGKSFRLNAERLETVDLYCNFASLEVYYDQCQLKPTGVETTVNCSFGSVVLYVPAQYQIIDKVSCSFGSVSIDSKFSNVDENAIKITLSGSVSFGSLEVQAIKEAI